MGKDNLEGAEAATPQAELLLGGVPDLPFAPNTFDAVLANFVINHVGDPRTAVAGLKRVCRPQGVVAVTIWPLNSLPLINSGQTSWKPAGLRPGQQRLPADEDFNRTEQGLNDSLAGAGLDAVHTTTRSWDFANDAEDLWAGPAGSVGGIGKIVTGQTPSMQSAMKHE